MIRANKVPCISLIASESEIPEISQEHEPQASSTNTSQPVA